MASYVGRLSQRVIYDQLRTEGSSWLQSHVLFADRQVIVLNKPPDLICQLNSSSKTSKKSGSMFLDPVFKDIRACYPTAHPYPVHRLDKMTTGSYIVPVQYSSAKSFSLQFQQRTVKKTYLTLVRGGERSFPAFKGRIEDPLLYTDGRPEIHPDGIESITEYELLASSPKVPISLVKLDLITGNKHQLRIHLAKVMKTPMLGDQLYSQKPLPESITSATSIPENRLFLHGCYISFYKYRPEGTRFRLGICAPVPPDFERICQDLDITLPSIYTKGSLLVDDETPVDDLDSDLALFSPQ